MPFTHIHYFIKVNKWERKIGEKLKYKTATLLSLNFPTAIFLVLSSFLTGLGFVCLENDH